VQVLSTLSLDNFNLSTNRRPDNAEYVHLLHLPPVQNPEHSSGEFVIFILSMQGSSSYLYQVSGGIRHINT